MSDGPGTWALSDDREVDRMQPMTGSVPVVASHGEVVAETSSWDWLHKHIIVEYRLSTVNLK